MWSFSFAGSMPSSTAAIGRAVGEGAGETVGDAAGWLAVAATAGDDAGGAAVVPPHEARTIASTTRCRPTIPVYRVRREISASAGRGRPWGLRGDRRGRGDRERRGRQWIRQREVRIGHGPGDAGRALLDREQRTRRCERAKHHAVCGEAGFELHVTELPEQRVQRGR